MLKPAFKFAHKTLLASLETLAVIALVIALAFGAFVWKVSQGPISIAFAKDYVQSELSSEEDEFSFQFDDMVFSWPELQGPLLRYLTNLNTLRDQMASYSLSIAQASSC